MKITYDLELDGVMITLNQKIVTLKLQATQQKPLGARLDGYRAAITRAEK